MIKIPFEYIDAFPKPARELSDQEKSSITSKIIDASKMEIVYYQSDEPAVEEVPVQEKSALMIAIESASPEDLQEVANLFKPLILGE
jgi:hypothetical protein